MNGLKMVEMKNEVYFGIVANMFHYAIGANLPQYLRRAEESLKPRYKTLEQQVAWQYARDLKYLHWDFVPRIDAHSLALNDEQLNGLFIEALRDAQRSNGLPTLD